MDSLVTAQTKIPWQDNLNTTLICRECKEVPPNLIEEFSSGDMVCATCGLVLGDRIVDTRSEWRTFSNDDQNNDDPSRVGDGPNLLLNGSQLETSISYGNGGSNARDLHRAQNKSSHDKSTKALLSAYKEIGALCDGWSLPKIVTDSAKHHFKRVNDAGAFRGKSQEVIVAGCIFIACRKCNVPRTFRETFALTKVSKKEIGKVFKALEGFFKKDDLERQVQMAENGIQINPEETYRTTLATDASALVVRYASHLGLSPQISKVAEGIAAKMDRLGILAGRSPLSQSAASLFFASQLMRQPKTTAEVSKVLGISDGTIRTVYKVLYSEKERLIEQEWLQDGRGDVALLPPV